MSLKLNSSGGGSVTISEQVTASNVTLNLPAVNGTVVTSADLGTVTPAMLSQKLTQGVSVAATSGTSIDFTSIPAWVKRITVLLNGVSTSGSSPYIVQLGDSGGIETTGYVTATQYVSSTSNTTRSTAYTNGFGLQWSTGSSGEVTTAVMQFMYFGGNIWLGTGTQNYSTASGGHSISGQKTLSDTLDRVRITTVNGTDTFDAGSINILYEG